MCACVRVCAQRILTFRTPGKRVCAWKHAWAKSCSPLTISSVFFRLETLVCVRVSVVVQCVKLSGVCVSSLWNRAESPSANLWVCVCECVLVFLSLWKCVFECVKLSVECVCLCVCVIAMNVWNRAESESVSVSDCPSLMRVCVCVCLP